MTPLFPKTYWTVIERAVNSSKTALNKIAADYVAPVQNFIARSGFSPEDAEDLTQEVFVIVCDSEFLKQADAAKGKFRTLVLLVTKNVMNDEWRKRYAKKRSGKNISLDGATVAEMLAAPTPSDEAFDREWWQSLLNGALAKLREENPKRHEILERHKVGGQSHTEIASALSLKPDDVNNEVRAAKKRMRDILLSQIRSYCSSDAEYEEELAQLKLRLS